MWLKRIPRQNKLMAWDCKMKSSDQVKWTNDITAKYVFYICTAYILAEYTKFPFCLPLSLSTYCPK